MSANFARAGDADEDLTYEFLLSSIPPLVMDKAPGQEKGLLWDIAQGLLNRLKAGQECKCKAKPTVLPWVRATTVLENEKGKFMLQMTRTDERENKYEWIVPVGHLTFAFVTKINPPPDTIEEAKALKRIAVYRGSHLEKTLRSKGFNTSLMMTNDSNASARLLNYGRVDAWYASVDEALWLYKKKVLLSRPRIGEAILTVPIWAVASKGTPKSMQEKIKRIFQEMEAEGTILTLKEKYGLHDHSIN
ncbi:MAG: transporter substrate-binding domain-containing protein [Methylocystaceae bacterium]|nr:transporter substrate-binding domain-containing protein [Methylocystaceae bacterium]